MASQNGSWKVTYTGAKEDGKFLEGLVKLWSNNAWLVLFNSDGFPLEGKVLEDGESLRAGLVIQLPFHLVCVNCPSSSESLARSPSAKCNPLRWNAMCSPLGLLDDANQRKCWLLLRPKAKRMILLDSDEVIIDAKYLLENETISPRCTIDMTALQLFVGESASSSELAASITEPIV
jgi:hypothetical protein